MKKILIITYLVCTSVTTFAQATYTPASSGSGIPTFDVANAINVGLQLQQMADDFKEFQAQTNALTQPLQQISNISTSSAMSTFQGGVQQLNQQMQSAITNSNAGTLGVMDALKTTVDSVNSFNTQQTNNLQSDSKRIDTLIQQSNSTNGTLAAQQAGNQLVGELTQQVQQLRAENLAKNQAELAARQAQQAREDSQRTLMYKLFDIKPPTPAK